MSPLSKPAKNVALVGMLSAAAVTLSALEWLLPASPLAAFGAKPGLSNIATMYAALEIGLAPALLISLVKSLFVAISRGYTAFLLSLCGGLASTLVMALALRLRIFGFMGVGVFGALTHNIAQLCIAMLLSGTALFNLLPILILFSILTGSLTGTALYLVLSALRKLPRYMQSA